MLSNTNWPASVKWTIRAAVLLGFAGLIYASSVSNEHVTATAPVMANSIGGPFAYVIQLDAKVYTCPVDYGVYIQDRAKGAQNIFQYLPPGNQIIASSQHPLLIACLKIQ